ncbi:hypothetical protein C7E25_25380, partial [Stenotrophomonas maltophilia]
RWRLPDEAIAMNAATRRHLELDTRVDGDTRNTPPSRWRLPDEAIAMNAATRRHLELDTRVDGDTRNT